MKPTALLLMLLHAGMQWISAEYPHREGIHPTPSRNISETDVDFTNYDSNSSRSVSRFRRGVVCPDGHSWKSFRGECFWEVSYEVRVRQWGDARAFCRSFGGDLASFHSADEEKAGLSVQHGTLNFPFWIGLQLDPVKLEYSWSDGTPLDWSNWAEGEPNHRSGALRCVSINARTSKWSASFCGRLLWWVCRTQQREVQPKNPIPPPTSLHPCSGGEEEDEEEGHELYHEGRCYTLHATNATWHQAKAECESLRGSLVSMHSFADVTFLLGLYASSPAVSGRSWLGLSSLGGRLAWADGSPNDFAFWAPGQPDDALGQQKCTSLDTFSGDWSDENCNSRMAFFCSRRYNASETPSASPPPPPTGNCRRGWLPHESRCYRAIGAMAKDQANWTEASEKCRTFGGHLASVRNPREQALLSLLSARLGRETWIGLQDRVEAGNYFWTDNSELAYTNWALAEPSFHGLKEDCVKLSSDADSVGSWRDDNCRKKLAFICQLEKDPNLPEPPEERGLRCLHPEGYLQIGAHCLKFFTAKLSYPEAERACLREGGHVISVTSPGLAAAATYLGLEANQSHWIGLRYDSGSQLVSWTAGWPLSVARWGTFQPGALREDLCFESKPNGVWLPLECEQERGYICHITAEKPPVERRVGYSCPDGWTSSGSGLCFQFGKNHKDWHAAARDCLSRGSYLASMYSKEDSQSLQSKMDPEVKSFFIGLYLTNQDSWTWMDGSAVRFVGWGMGEPRASNRSTLAEPICVEARAPALRWFVADCLAARHYACTRAADVGVLPEKARRVDQRSGVSAATLTGIVIGALVLLGVVLLLLWRRQKAGLGRSYAFRNPFRTHSMSFENALYDADSASMRFEADDNEK